MNLHDYKVGADLKPHEKVSIYFDYHWFFLDTNGSLWYMGVHYANRPVTPGASTTIGQELDIFLDWRLMKHMRILVGYSHFHAGAFLSDSGAADNANYILAQTVVDF